MTGIRVLVGTRKGAFILTSDGARRDWAVAGPYFSGWEIYHLKASPADPNRIWASLSNDWLGQEIHRSDDGGANWQQVGGDFSYLGDPGDHLWYDGSTRPWKFTRIWHIEPSVGDRDLVWAGAEDAALFRSTDGGDSWREMPGLRAVHSAQWMPGAGGLGLHSILLDPTDPQRIYAGISAAGMLRSDDAGENWRAATRGLGDSFLPDPDTEVGHCVHRIALAGTRPSTIYMQKHRDTMRSDDAGENWRKITGNLPTDFGMVIDVHAHDPETVYVVPIASERDHVTPEGRLRVYRSRSGGGEWEALTEGLPQQHCYVNVLREAMSVDSLDACGIYFGTTGGQVYASADSGDTWAAIVRDLPSVVSVEVQTLP